MAVPLFATGFEGGSVDAALREGWSFPSQTGGPPVVNTDANFRHLMGGLGGSYSMGLLDVGYICLPDNTGRWTHFWFRHNDPTPVDVFEIVFYLSSLYPQFLVRIATTGFISLVRGFTTVATSASALDLTVGHWFAIKMKVAEAVDGGVCEVYIDDNPVAFVSFSGDTQNTTTALGTNWNLLLFGGDYNYGQYFYLDDVIVTSEAEGQVAECTGIRCRPKAAGDSTNWTPTGGPNWSDVRDSEDPATYVDAASAALDDLYHIDPVWASEVKFVKVAANASSQRSATMRALIKSGGTTVASSAFPGISGAGGADMWSFGTIYGGYWDEDPSTSLPFTEAAIQDLQIGPRSV